MFLDFMCEYFPQFMGVFSAIIGTTLGWLLRNISDQIGKTEIIIDEFKDEISNGNEYAFKVQFFLCNHTLQPRYIKNPTICFYNKNNVVLKKGLIKSDKVIGSFLENSLCNIILLKYNEPVVVTLGNVIKDDEYRKLSEISKIKLCFENENKSKKKIIIKKAFSLHDVTHNEKINSYSFYN